MYLVNVFIHSPTYGFTLDITIFTFTGIAFLLQWAAIECYASPTEFADAVEREFAPCTESYITTIVTLEFMCNILFSIDLICYNFNKRLLVELLRRLSDVMQ